MPHTFLVETYRSELTDGDMRDRAVRVAAATAELRRQGRLVVLLGCLAVPTDEVCFWRFSGDSLADVEAASRHAGLDAQRIAPSIDLDEDARDVADHLPAGQGDES